jgi:hypothetical protein
MLTISLCEKLALQLDASRWKTCRYEPEIRLQLRCIAEIVCVLVTFNRTNQIKIESN